MAAIAFTKMNGAGNDFVIIDARIAPITLTDAQIRHICNREGGVGCDQLIVMEPSDKADVFMRIYNADGSQVASCGNATRCIGWRVMQEQEKPAATIETLAGVVQAWKAGDQLVMVDMGTPKFDWKDIPLSEPRDAMDMQISEGMLSSPVVLSMGNPHAVFFVSDVQTVPLKEIGPILEHHPIFPERANIEVAQIVWPTRINLRVWERGAGETLACGTGACATLVAAHLRGHTGRKATVILPGGELVIEWLPDVAGKVGSVLMTGPVATEFEGELTL